MYIHVLPIIIKDYSDITRQLYWLSFLAIERGSWQSEPNLLLFSHQSNVCSTLEFSFYVSSFIKFYIFSSDSHDLTYVQNNIDNRTSY